MPAILPAPCPRLLLASHLVEGDRRAVDVSMSQALFYPESAAAAPDMAPAGTRKAPPRRGWGPMAWARSEGLEPPAF